MPQRARRLAFALGLLAFRSATPLWRPCRQLRTVWHHWFLDRVSLGITMQFVDELADGSQTLSSQTAGSTHTSDRDFLDDDTQSQQHSVPQHRVFLTPSTQPSKKQRTASAAPSVPTGSAAPPIPGAADIGTTNNKWRFHGCTLLLTYPAVADDDATPEAKQALSDFICATGPVSKLVVAMENHGSAAVEQRGKHYHAAVLFEKKFSTYNVRLFDWTGPSGKVYHPNWKTHTSKLGFKNFSQYLVVPKKDKEVDPDPILVGIVMGELIAGDKWTYLIGIDTERKFLEECVRACAKDWLMRGKQILENWKILHPGAPRRVAAQFAGPYPEHYYPPAEWNIHTHSLLLHGPTNLGKTQFARYLLAHMTKQSPFIVKGDLNALKRWDKDAPLIFDDMSFLNVDESISREITDVPDGADINVKYATVDIAADTPRIFTSNMQYPFRNPADAVYKRRVVSWNITATPSPLNVGGLF